ncbi:MAG TPA: toll/interleukin-1 receptor domain-containing protein [Stellaceae bacterium]|jgi:hypothetical protein
MLFVLHHQTADDRPRQVFVSYAHEDEVWKERVVEALRPLETQRRIAAWHDRKLVPSEDWARTIDARLAESDVFLLLISPDFIASPFCRVTEVPRAVQRCEVGEAVLVPIILRECPWQGEAFARFQAYPLDGTPLEAVADPHVFEDLREKVHLALLGWWYPRRPRAGTGPHALWQLDYRPAAGTEPPAPAVLVERLRALTEEPDIESSGSAEAQFVGGEARPIDTSLLLDGPAGAFAKLEALHGEDRLSAALGVEVVALRIVLGASIQARSGPATAADLLEAHEQLVLSAGSREVPDLPQVLMLRDDDPDWRMILPARGTEGATPKALFPAMQALFTEYFNTILAAPDGRLTVNLSTYQPGDILHPALRRTRLGRDLVEQDCRLKQFAVSLLHPDTPTGAAYWRGLRERANALGLDAGAEMLAYQKVWIVTGEGSLGGKDPHQPLGNPGLALLGARETDRGVWVERCDLKVMCEVDYLAMEHHQGSSVTEGAGPLSDASVALFREIVVPVLTEEVNQGGGSPRCARSITPSCSRSGFGGRSGICPHSLPWRSGSIVGCPRLLALRGTMSGQSRLRRSTGVIWRCSTKVCSGVPALAGMDARMSTSRAESDLVFDRTVRGLAITQ